MLLGHGAGGDMHSVYLDALAARLQAAGVPCVRYTARTTHLGTRVAAAKAVMRAVAEDARVTEEFRVRRWVLAGHSMGGRVAAAVAHELGTGAVPAVVLLSYPLHPPQQPGKLRDAPLTSLRQVCVLGGGGGLS